MFRHSGKLITHPVTKQGGNSKVLAKIDDDPNTLPDVWVMREAKPDTKLWRNLQVLEDNPLMLQALAFEESEGKQRPSLNEFVGWVKKHTHQIHNLCSTFSFTKCAAIKMWAKPNLRLPPAITPGNFQQLLAVQITHTHTPTVSEA